jgi:hypothetical protein
MPRRHGEKRTPWGDRLEIQAQAVGATIGTESESKNIVPDSKGRAMLCLVSDETMAHVRRVAETLGIECVRCHTTRDAIERLRAASQWPTGSRYTAALECPHRGNQPLCCFVT